MKQNIIYIRNTQEKQKETVLANRTIYTMIWYAFYNLWPANGVGPILTALETTYCTFIVTTASHMSPSQYRQTDRQTDRETDLYAGVHTQCLQRRHPSRLCLETNCSVL